MRSFIDFAVPSSLDAWRFALLALLLASGLMALGLYLSHVSGIGIIQLLRDYSAIAKLSPIYSSLELAGIVITAGGAAVTLFGSTIAPPPWRLFLLMGGLLSLTLCLDDLFLFHEKGYYLRLSESKIYFAYLCFLIGIFVANRWIVAATPLGIFMIAIVLFGGSAVADKLSDHEQYKALLPTGAEDLLELFAFTFWAAYFVSSTRTALLHPERAGAAKAEWEGLMAFLARRTVTPLEVEGDKAI